MSTNHTIHNLVGTTLIRMHYIVFYFFVLTLGLMLHEPRGTILPKPINNLSVIIQTYNQS